jgi:hypothetical protein
VIRFVELNHTKIGRSTFRELPLSPLEKPTIERELSDQHDEKGKSERVVILSSPSEETYQHNSCSGWSCAFILKAKAERLSQSEIARRLEIAGPRCGGF